MKTSILLASPFPLATPMPNTTTPPTVPRSKLSSRFTLAATGRPGAPLSNRNAAGSAVIHRRGVRVIKMDPLKSADIEGSVLGGVEGPTGGVVRGLTRGLSKGISFGP